MTRSGRVRSAAGALGIALLLAGCGSGSPSSGGASDLSGTIVVSGSSTVEPISVRVAERFAGANPNVDISVDGPGTGDGFELFCNGETEISDASRPINTDEEVPLCDENGVEFIELKVAIDGISVLTSPENEAVTCLTFGDLYSLTGPESQGFTTWSDANDLATEVGGKGSLPDTDLVLVGPGEESGTYDYWVEAVIEGIAEERKIPEDEWATRPDYQSSPNDNVIIEQISGNPSSLGWVGYAFFKQNEGTVKAIEVDGGDGCVAPTEETISDTTYPISRYLYIYVNRNKLETNEALEAYVDYYLSDEGLASVSEVGYVPLHEEDLTETLDIWENRETGTREG